MPRVRIPSSLLKGAAGFLAGLLVWLAMTEPYHRVLAPAAQAVVRLFESPAVTELRPDGRQILVVRSDVPRGSNRPGIPAHDLTFNVILLTALFAANRGPASNRNVLALLASVVLLVPIHVLAVVMWLQDIYANDPRFAVQGYSEPERAFWSYALYFYRLVGQFAIPLVLWWLLTPGSLGAGSGGTTPPRARRAGRTR